jgi:hypothetical protein
MLAASEKAGLPRAVLNWLQEDTSAPDLLYSLPEMATSKKESYVP